METPAGRVIHFYAKISVASVEVKDILEVGNLIHIKGHITDFDQKIESMQAQHEKISKASAGMIVGIKVNDYVRKNDCVYRVKD